MNQKNPSFPCPKCNTLIGISLEDLLNAKKLTCPNCSLNFKIGADESKSTLESFQKIHNKLSDHN